MELTKETYFTSENKYISNSKISDWLKCKDYFKRKHIDGTVIKNETPALRLGSAVDTIVTAGRAEFDRLYVPVTRRSKNPPEGVIELPMGEYNQAVEVSARVMATSAYKALDGFTSQKILKFDADYGLFEGICGIPDWFRVDSSGAATIVDLKTSKTIDPVKYHFHCLTYGYYRQAAMYQILLANNFDIKTIKEIECRHLVVEKDPDGIYNCRTFILDPDTLCREIDFIRETLDDIKKEKNFLPSDTSWEDAVTIGKWKTVGEDDWGVEI